ncbi:Cytochrome c553 [Methylomagnum ishizawai]|uniref:Cytochrome c553 n=1 Tax=Methylomagnum ishizawai TaxID=1760988 RepID=A0A1Y6CZC9_9GAMM|nr:c-type cytochrome [Methylomagnum ishizawai]SMF95737.1 Cytochrome c553 [Methylomagnum ishizawai]
MRPFPKPLLSILALSLLPFATLGGTGTRPDAATLARACGGCHGAHGQGFDTIPALTGIPEAEFVRRMKAFREGLRRATVMDRIAKGYTDEDFAAVAKYFSH